MKRPLIEACVDSYASAMAASRAGADRLELCVHLVIGGTTPTHALFRQVQRDSGVPINVLIRPRFGDFLYTEPELEEMCEEIAAFRDLGANGVVIGALTPDGELDLAQMRRMMACAGQMEVTLHRAFDMTRDPFRALEDAVSLGCRTILSSGQAANAALGAPLLAKLNGQAAGRIDLMAGCGVKRTNIAGIADTLKEYDADLLLLEEVDTNSTRTYHVNELELLQNALTQYPTSAFAQNYDSPFLFYPITQPHGRSRSGIWTASKFAATSASRVSLPVETGLTKFLDLDRCYSVTRLPVENGKELCLYTFHLSAYTSDGKIATEQLELLLNDMQAEYEKGNYAIAGGDFNKDLPEGGSEQYFGVSTEGHNWAQPIKRELFENRPLTLCAPIDEEDPVASCRYADGPIHDGQLRVIVDGFIVSDNVSVAEARVLDDGFAHSDHNPVRLSFRLLAK